MGGVEDASMVGGMEQHLSRIGLSRAALKTAILADIQGVEGLDGTAEVIASAVAERSCASSVTWSPRRGRRHRCARDSAEPSAGLVLSYQP